MRRIGLFVAAAFAGIVLLTYLYFHGRGSSASEHQRVKTLLSQGREAHAALDANLMRSRDFLLLNYDPVVKNEQQFRNLCRDLNGPDLSGELFSSLAVSAAVDRFCGSVSDLLSSVEMFKSSNAILRNSILYVQGLAAASRGGHQPSHPLLNATLSYFLLPNELDRGRIAAALKKGPVPGIDEALLRHVRTIFQRKDEVDGVLREVLDHPASDRLEELEATYERAYVESERTASFYRQLLFSAAILLFALVLTGVARLVQAARKITEANERLEGRVRERTRELSESQALILQQQQSLLSTAKLSALGEMAAGVAHEINNPLAIIQLAATQLTDLVHEQPPREKAISSMLNAIVKTTDRIAKIVQGLRTFSRDGSRDPFAPVQVQALLEETTAFCRERFLHHSVLLHVDTEGRDLTFEGRATQVSQVLLNLLLNAFDAIHDQPDKWVRLSARDLGERIELRVTDSGQGIPEDTRRKIFQPFFTTKEIGKGTGMGLSIALGLVRSHGGDLRVDETCPHTSFVIELPKVQAKSAVGPLAAAR